MEMSTQSVPGVVLINKYDTHSTHENFSNYINYISRKEAVAPKDFQQYLEYMDNPEKQANLFTDTKDFLKQAEKDELKETFSNAENKSGVMWETVISFDNSWLEENGLYDSTTGWTDEDELKRLTRGAVNRLEKQEGLMLTWTGAIHHNTDNIHIHIASVEKVPRHKEKEYQVVKFPESWLWNHKVLSKKDLSEIRKDQTVSTSKKINGTLAYKNIMKQLRRAVQEETGRPFFCRNQIKITKNNSVQVSLSKNAGAVPDGARIIGTYKDIDATFKEKSMDAAKTYIVHEIIRDDDALKKINQLIRDEIINPTREQIPEFIKENEDLSRSFLDIYHDLAISGTSRRDWSYGTNKISSVRPAIDKLSEKILDSYFPKERDKLKSLVNQTANQYRRAYGDNEKAEQYKQGRKEDLKKRMGNAILYGLREYDRSLSSGHSSESSSSNSSSQKEPAPAPKHHASSSSQADALQYVLHEMENEIRKTLNAAFREEQEQQYQFNQELTEDERLEQERIKQGERDAQASISR